MNDAFKRCLSSIGYDDYEEAELLGQLEKLQLAANARILSPPDAKLKVGKDGLTKEESERKSSLISLLGYDPSNGERPQRARGRPRDAALPSPLPVHGTELRTPLGDVYTVHGYAFSARSQVPSVILYVFNGNLIARNITNLLVGTLSSGEPLVTWPDDPRGLKPNQPVPLGRQRTVRKADLVNDVHADPDRGWRPNQGPRSKGAY